ncbi:pentatricopeptide repeat-containing protein at1g62930 chloroplastic [Phtheirospermum japonicum]|uniref:Pentatricopeptide repeat-containing protein at1g62930 chloroplastic n=1 Tax=Phtheirospermum japonicum TaxID=374723 RepID=A0A830D7V0_9LAMI|nr:pentatricopeptide repeat-containing protein at1g62930 chloroplastic [Phtheirospermum japonicum]
MKIKGFCFGHFPSSSPISYESGNFLFFSRSPLLFLSLFRHFGTKSVANREKMKLGLGNIRKLDDALCLYDDMSRTRPLTSVIQFNQLLSRVINLKEYSAAIHLFNHICNLGISVDDYSMNIAMNCYCLSNRVDYGFSILGWFFKRGCVPDVFTFNTLLKGLFRENKVNEAQELFRKMVKEELCELSVVTYGTVIDGLCKAGNVAVAIELLRVMEKGRRSCKPDTHIYSMVIDGLCKDRMIDSALNLFDEMSEKDIVPNVVTYSALICGLCNLSRWGEVKMLLEKMATMNVAPDVWSYTILINGYCKKKNIDEAMLMFREVPRRGLQPNIVTYNTILQGLFRGGRCSEALEIFGELQAVGLKPNFYTYCNMLGGLFKNGQVERALLLLDELEHKEGEHLHIPYYNIAMDGLIEAKRLEQACVIFSDLASKGLEPNVVTYTILIKGCCENGQTCLYQSD